MNNLQLFRMYRKFERARSYAREDRALFGPECKRGYLAIYGIAIDFDRYARDWQKWDRLAESAAEELEKRLAPQAFTGAGFVFTSIPVGIIPEDPHCQARAAGKPFQEIGENLKDVTHR